MLGLEMADFNLAAVGPGAKDGLLPISARPNSQEAYEGMFALAFPGTDPNTPTFRRQLGVILESWARVKSVNPMLRDEEIAGIKWMLYAEYPTLPAEMETLLYAISGIKPQAPVERVSGFHLTSDEIDFIVYKLRLVFPDAKTGMDASLRLGHSGPDARIRRDLAQRKGQRLASLVFKYKLEQMEWEDGVPMWKDNRTEEEVLRDDAPKIVYFYQDTEEREKAAEDKVKRKRKRLESEAASLQAISTAPALNELPGAQTVAFTFQIPAGVLGGAAGGVINVMTPNPVDPASMIRASLVGALIKRVSIAQDELTEAEHAVKRVRIDDAERKARWEAFLELGDEVKRAFLDANRFTVGQVPLIEAEKYRSRIHNYDKPLIVSPEERAVYNSEKGVSAFVGNIGNKATSAHYGGLGVFQ
jgi:hypothetical protein